MNRFYFVASAAATGYLFGLGVSVLAASRLGTAAIEFALTAVATAITTLHWRRL